MFVTIRRHPVLTAAFLLSAALTLVFVLRLGVGLVYWSLHERKPIEPWMTVGYVAHSWDLDPREIGRLAGLSPPQERPLTLEAIARARGVPVEEVIASVEAAVEQLRRESAPP